MNFLIATSRQSDPHHDCTVLGIRALLERAFGVGQNCVFYDTHWMQALRKIPFKHRPQANLFHHQSLHPFDAILICEKWQGVELEPLYALVTKTDRPLWIVDPLPENEVTALERNCLERKNSYLLVPKSPGRVLENLNVARVLLPHPLRYAGHSKKTALSCLPPVTVALSENWEALQNSPLLLETLEGLGREGMLTLVATTVDVYMHLSHFFPKSVQYSHSELDLVHWISGADVFLTQDEKLIEIAVGAGIPSLLLSEGSADLLPKIKTLLEQKHRSPTADPRDWIQFLYSQLGSPKFHGMETPHTEALLQ